jgi:hypothetical protein
MLDDSLFARSSDYPEIASPRINLSCPRAWLDFAEKLPRN